MGTKDIPTPDIAIPLNTPYPSSLLGSLNYTIPDYSPFNGGAYGLDVANSVVAMQAQITANTIQINNLTAQVTECVKMFKARKYAEDLAPVFEYPDPNPVIE